MSSLLLWKNVTSQSNYNKSTDYHIPMPTLLNHANILSNNIYILSSELYKEFITLYSMDRDLYFKYMKSCPTASITTPLNKRQTLKMKEQDLIHLVIHLMLSWEDPMSHLKAQAVRLPKISLNFMQKAELIQQKIQQLLEWLKMIARQVDFQFKDYGERALWTELPFLLSTDEKVFRITFYNLCCCLRRDTFKVDTFLRVLNYRITQYRQS
uniref:Prolactin n=2 Tax=Cavia porcellus TaxID=10141 RepID=H0VHM6_CAVPO